MPTTVRMSSTETLNFGPEWLRALSGGTSVTSPPPSPAVPTTAKFKLAEFRYGREEMLALFVEKSEVPPDLLQAPHLICEDTLQPLALIPLTEDDQRAFSGGVNSETHFRPRGGLSTRGRSAPPRGRGRGRGEGFSRSISQNEDGSGPPFARGGGREYSRRESWDERGFGRNAGRGTSDDGPVHRKPIRRSEASDDWRSDIIRGSGDGADGDAAEATDWRPPAPSRRDWRGRSNSNWRDGGRDWSNDSTYHPRDRRTIGRTRSLGGSKYDQGDSGLMPEWAEDGDDGEVGVFDASGAFQSNSKSSKETKENDKAGGPRKPVIGRTSLRKIDERDKSSASDKEEVYEQQTPPKIDDGQSESKPTLSQEQTPNEKEKQQKSQDQLQRQKTATPTSQEAEPKNVDNTAKSEKDNNEDAANKAVIDAILPNTAQLTEAPNVVQDIIKPTEQEEVDSMHHLEQAALKLVDSLSESDDKADWSSPALPNKSSATEAIINQAVTKVNAADLATKWFYKDPQGETQGPFTSQEMREWFVAGYFTLNLLVKRAFDPLYVPLGELMTRLGGNPFSSTTQVQQNTPDLQTEALQQQLLIQQQLQALQQQQQQQQQQKQQQQQQQMQQQLRQQQLLRNYQQQNALYNAVIAQLGKSPEFLALPSPQQQAMVAQYMAVLQQQQQQQQQQQTTTSLPVSSGSDTQLSIWDVDPAIVRRPSPVHMAGQQQQTQQQQQQPALNLQFLEMLKQKSLEKEQAEAKQKQELEEKKRKEEEMKRIQQLKALRQAEERRKQLELEEAKRQQEEAERILREQEERRRLDEENRLKAKMEEDARKHKEEEERQRQEAIRRLAKQEEERRRAQEEEIQRKIQEERDLQKKRKQEEQEIKRAQLLKEEEMRRRALEEKQRQEEAIRKQKEQEIQRQKDEAARKRQQEQLKNMKLPSTANWAQQQPQVQSSMSSVVEIQKLQEEKERERKKLEQEHMRAIQQQQQQQQQRSVWGGTPVSQSQASAPSHGRPLSLMEIQMEEARKQQQVAQLHQQQAQTQHNPDLSIQAAAAWGGRQASGGSVWGQQSFQQQQQQQQQLLWEQQQQQAQSNNARKQQQNASRQQAKQSRGKSRGGGGSAAGGNSAESNSVMALFQQQQKQQSTQDPFVAWCDSQIKRMPAAANLDVPTFVAFLRDVESPYDVKDYVTSYLGETKDARDFAEAFLHQRSAIKKQQQQQVAATNQAGQHANVSGWNQSQPVSSGSASVDNDDDTVFVTGNTKRGKRKQRKLQKVDPSILGFSVNAASDRVNMGEIETPNDG